MKKTAGNRHTSGFVNLYIWQFRQTRCYVTKVLLMLLHLLRDGTTTVRSRGLDAGLSIGALIIVISA